MIARGLPGSSSAGQCGPPATASFWGTARPWPAHTSPGRGGDPQPQFQRPQQRSLCFQRFKEHKPLKMVLSERGPRAPGSEMSKTYFPDLLRFGRGRERRARECDNQEGVDITFFQTTRRLNINPQSPAWPWHRDRGPVRPHSAPQDSRTHCGKDTVGKGPGRQLSSHNLSRVAPPAPSLSASGTSHSLLQGRPRPRDRKLVSNGHRLSIWGEERVLEKLVVMFIQQSECT